MSKSKPWTMVDAHGPLLVMLDHMEALSESHPEIFLDLEGEDLSRTGTLAILQILLLPKAHVYLVDCLTLKEDAFLVENATGICLKSILESATIKKAIFDVRNDSAALFHQYGISLAGVEDIQLMEVATRTRPKRFLTGLAKCIEYDLALSASDRRACTQLKARGRQLFEPKLGGSYAVFIERPLKEEVLRYCVQDVCILPAAWDSYSKKMNESHRRLVLKETARRILATHSQYYNGKGQHMAKCGSPWEGMHTIPYRSTVTDPSNSLPADQLARCLAIMAREPDENEWDDLVEAIDLSSSDGIDDLASILARQKLAE